MNASEAAALASTPSNCLRRRLKYLGQSPSRLQNWVAILNSPVG